MNGNGGDTSYWTNKEYPVLLLALNVCLIISTVVCNILDIRYIRSGPGSSVGIATELRAGRSGKESPWGRDFPPFQTDRGAHPASCAMGIGSFKGVEAAGAWG